MALENQRLETQLRSSLRDLQRVARADHVGRGPRAPAHRARPARRRAAAARVGSGSSLSSPGELVEAHPERAGRRLRELAGTWTTRWMRCGPSRAAWCRRYWWNAASGRPCATPRRGPPEGHACTRAGSAATRRRSRAPSTSLPRGAAERGQARRGRPSASVSLWEDEDLRFEVQGRRGGASDAPTRARRGAHEHARPDRRGGRPPGDRLGAGRGHLRRGDVPVGPGGAAASGGDAAASGPPRRSRQASASTGPFATIAAWWSTS